MKRPVWLAAGVAIGVGGTLWAEQRVRRQVRQITDRLAPDNLVTEARTRVRSALDAGRREQRRTEDELWRDLEGAPPHPPPEARPTAHRRPSGGRALPNRHTTPR